MTSKSDIVEILGRERRVEQMVSSITHKTWCADLADLSQMVYLALLTYDDDKIIDLWEHGQINFFIARVIINQFRSSRSPFHALFRKYQQKSVDITDKDYIDE